MTFKSCPVLTAEPLCPALGIPNQVSMFPARMQTYYNSCSPQSQRAFSFYRNCLSISFWCSEITEATSNLHKTYFCFTKYQTSNYSGKGLFNFILTSVLVNTLQTSTPLLITRENSPPLWKDDGSRYASFKAIISL